MVSAEPPFRSVHEFYPLWIALMLLRQTALIALASQMRKRFEFCWSAEG